MALYINNANEKRKSHAEVLSILKQVHNELSTSILEADEIARTYMLKDSLIHEKMLGRVTKEEYLSPYKYIWLGLVTNYIPLTIQKEGYLNLMSHSKHHSSDLDSIISSLKEMYTSDVEGLKTTNDLLKDLIAKHLDWLKYNAPWSANSYFNNQSLSDEELDFYLNSFYYQNIVSNYHLIGIGNHHLAVWNFRFKAAQIYSELGKILNKNGIETPDSPPFNTSLELYSDLKGTFVNGGDTLKLEYVNHELKVVQSKNQKARVIGVAPNQWVTEPGIFTYLLRDSTQKMEALQVRFGDFSENYTIIPD